MGVSTKLRFPLAIYAAVVLSVLTSAALLLWPASDQSETSWPNPSEYIDGKLYDLKLSLKSPKPLSPDIVHIDVDDTSVDKFGLWPWDRKITADIIRKLDELGVKTIVFDVIYAAKGRSPLGDADLASAVAESKRVVLASAFTMSPPKRELVIDGDDARLEAYYNKTWNIRVPGNFRLFQVATLKASFVPLLPLIEGCKYVGHIKSSADRDGVHRRVPLLVRLEDRCVPSLSLAALVSYLQVDLKDVRLENSGYLTVHSRGGEIRIPVAEDGTMLVDWQQDWNGFPHLTVASILEKGPDSPTGKKLKDKIVVIGVSFTGTTDIGVNPFSSKCILSRVHSNAINTMLRGSFIRVVRPFPFFVPIAAILAICFAFIAVRLKLERGVILFLSICALYTAFAFAAFFWTSYEVPFSGPLLAFFLPSVACLTVLVISMESEAHRVSNALKRYLSPEMLEVITGLDHEVDLSTRRKELTILFADIKGFSTMSETADAEYVGQFLNDFFEAMTGAIFDNKGTIDKFLGDGFLAFFGDPVDLENHALAAVQAAVRINKEMVKLNLKWTTAGIKEFEQGIRLRIGINTGQVMVGNVGSQRRMEYTVVGSAVNIASRLEKEAPPGGILISARTQALAGETVRCGEPRTIKVRGVEKAITVYEVLSILQ